MRPEVLKLRSSVFHFYQNSILPACKNGMRILEIGPMDIRYTPVKNYYINLQSQLLPKLNIEYKTCDKFLDSNADYIHDILDLTPEMVGKFDIIIACEVIEHVGKIWLLPEILNNILNNNGQIFLSSPFYFYLHNPFPDYWRISEYGYYELFNGLFNVKIDKILDNDNDDRKPLNYQVILTKKE
jgi:hypothetical protein